MIGAIVLTRRELLHEARPRRPVVRRPLVGASAAPSQTAASQAEDAGQLPAESGQ
jgi:hypothetical protein